MDILLTKKKKKQNPMKWVGVGMRRGILHCKGEI
jgi:hypothetical protein